MIDSRSRKFSMGFLIALLLFVATNIYSYVLMPDAPSMSDGAVTFGFPLNLYEYGGFWTHSVILWQGLLVDLLIAGCTSTLLGWMFAKRPRLP
jgi:hypothetical protein